QLRLEDSPAFEKVRATKAATKPTESKSPVLDALRMYPKQIALAAGAFLAVQVTFYILIAFVSSIGAKPALRLKPSPGTMLVGVLVGAVVMVPAIFISGALSD